MRCWRLEVGGDCFDEVSAGVREMKAGKPPGATEIVIVQYNTKIQFAHFIGSAYTISNCMQFPYQLLRMC